MIRPAGALSLAAAVATIAAFASGCIYAPLDLGFGEIGKVQEVTLVESKADEKILMLRIDGEITDEGDDGGGLFGGREGTTAQVKDVLDLARKDENIVALLVRVNSPGGGVTASDIIYREIGNWKRETKKPVVALFMDVAASGGYYVSCAADRIVAHPTGVTGSIGVLAMLPNVSGLADKIGVKVYTVKSGDRKDLGNPFRPMAEDELKTFQALIDQIYVRFLDVVVEGRRGAVTREGVRRLADGRVFTAAEAKAAKLIDDIGYFEEAFAVAKKLANVRDARVVTFERKGFGTGRRTIYSKEQAQPIQASIFARGPEGDRNLIKLDAGGLLPSPRPMFKYLWLPAVN